jgi:N-acetylated-alpha-linked acidic dipeptidase
MDVFGDPGFVYHRAMAQMWGVLAINIADSVILPFNYTAYATEMLDYVLSVDKLLAAAGAPPTVLTRPLRDAQQRFVQAARDIQAEIKRRLAQGSQPRAADRELDDRLIQTERAFLSPNGLNGPAEDSSTRSWYRHTIYAPAQHNDYASTVFPGIVDAVDWAASRGGQWSEVQHQIWEVARAIDRAARVLVGEFQ